MNEVTLSIIRSLWWKSSNEIDHLENLEAFEDEGKSQVVTVHVRRAYVLWHSFLTSALDRDERAISGSSCFTPVKVLKGYWCSLNREMGGRQRPSGIVLGKKILSPLPRMYLGPSGSSW
jgi:hypothetical protein